MKGTYILLIRLIQRMDIQIGALGQFSFKEGGYAYVGSALGKLEGRIKRHLRQKKNLHWHIDYLLTEARLEEVYYGISDERKECEIAQELSNDLTSYPNFGSSDCDCKSHLFYSEDIPSLKKKLKSSFRKVGLEPKTWEDGR